MSGIRLVAPAQSSPVGGLLSVITPKAVPSGKEYALLQGGFLESSIIGVKPKPVPAMASDDEKDFAQQDVDPDVFKPVTVYAGIKTPLMNRDPLQKENLQEIILGGSSHALETYVQSELLNPVAENLGTARNPRQAVGRLEQWAGENLNVLPLIQANRLATSMMRDLKGEPDSLKTKQGTPVANGSGYSSAGPEAAPEGSAWIYVSAHVGVYQHQFEVREVHAPHDNDNYLLGEISYLPILQGPVAAILLEG